MVDGARTDYAYDAADQLVREAAAGGPTTTYAYDANGNRLSKTVDGVAESYAYDDGDKLLGRSGGRGGPVTYGYDACGPHDLGAGERGHDDAGYDYEDRLTSLRGPGVSEAYAYNGADARVGKSGSGGSRAYRRDGVGATSPVLSDGSAVMVPGISERVASGGSRYSHLDRLGTSARTTDASANVIDSRSYDAFGLPTSIVNPSGSESGASRARSGCRRTRSRGSS